MNLYELIELAIRLHDEMLPVGDGVNESDIRHAVRWVMRDNPDIFWFVHQYRLEPGGRKVSFRYQFSQEKSRLLQKSIDDVVKNDFQIEYVRTLGVYEQVMYVYKWLLSYCNYNVNSAYNQTIDSVFVRRNSVCTGYAKAAQYLFHLLGMESRLVFGRLHGDTEKGRHCWNIVVIDGQPYHLDVCMGDPAVEDMLKKAGETGPKCYSDINYICFCVSTAEIAKTRSIEDAESLPICEKSLDETELVRLSRDVIIERRDRCMNGPLGFIISDSGCLLSSIGSSADILLCSRDKHTVLKRFRGSDKWQCHREHDFMTHLKGCKHLLQLNDCFTNESDGILAVEQLPPIVDLLCSHYYRPDFRGVLILIRDVAQGWLECSERGILYRDIHICNTFKANDGSYKLGDFGSCAYVNDTRDERVGSPWFMAPETYNSGHFDERSAVYSITAVLYFILNGLRPPFVGRKTLQAALQLKMTGKELPMPALLGALPAELRRVIQGRLIERGCAFDPSSRFESVRDLLKAVDGLLSSNLGFYELPLAPQSAEDILDNIPSPAIGRDSFHKYAYGAEVEAASLTTYLPSDVEIYCHTMGGNVSYSVDAKCSSPNQSYSPRQETASSAHRGNTYVPRPGFWSRLFKYGKKTDTVYSSIFAPAEVKPKSNLLVQVYLHLYEETEKVKNLAQEAQKEAKRRDYIPLQCKLKKGDKVDVQLNIYGESLLKSEQKSVVWQGAFTKCSFNYFVPGNMGIEELSCIATLSVNGIPVGEMTFITGIVHFPRSLNPEIVSHKFSKVFISYSHKDEEKVKFLAEGFELMSIPHFFDRHNLKTGDIFPLEIQHYIDTADLFILCWSENASKSDYVKKELEQALMRAYPQIKPPQAAELAIYPMSIEPRAELPANMKEYYHFGQL